MWENQYDYIPTRELIIILKLACVAKYTPCFRIHGKPYLLSEEERQRQIRAQRERQGPLNPRRRDDDEGPSTTPTQSLGPTVQPTTPTSQPFQIMIDLLPEEPQPLPEVDRMRNPARTYRRPPYGTDFDRHGH
ncbi:hypothetical protein PVK06_023591 [Gossypium arboreum]|uniref:Uncharacterized protein n=1 Tax=Gossypium arboreum TaxID=29729 RepID=A0ABR0PBR2_GOSAR|nr:hypothetical protein PVK06_023591 [Gossypium arboreum]